MSFCASFDMLQVVQMAINAAIATRQEKHVRCSQAKKPGKAWLRLYVVHHRP